MTYTHLLFDLDGTLTDPREGITKCVQHALHHFGIEEDDLDKLTLFIGPPLISSFMEFYGLTREEAQKAVEVYRERFSTIGIFENKVLEGIPEMLGRLKAQGKILAVASSKPEEFVLRILDHFALTDYFDEITGASMDGKRSEKKDVIEEALARLGRSHDRKGILMVGDRKHDVEGAAACGLDSLGIYTGFAPAGELEKAGATYVSHSSQEAADFLQSC